MSASSRLRRGAPRFLFCLFCAAGATSCNAIFGIQDGQLTGGGGPGGSGATGGGGTGTQGGGGATGGNDTTGGGGSTTTGTGPCAAFPTPDGQDTVWAKQATGTFEDRGIAIGWQPGGGVIVAGAKSETVGAVKLGAAGGNIAESVFGAYATTVGGALVQAAGGNRMGTTKGVSALTVGGVVMANAAGKVTMKAKKINIKVLGVANFLGGGGILTLTPASASFVGLVGLDASGTIKISGNPNLIG